PVDAAGGRGAADWSVQSPDGLADAMLAAYRAPDRAERVAAAQRWAEGFRLDAVARQLGDLLQDHAARRQQSPVSGDTSGRSGAGDRQERHRTERS
ncbi:MAG: hypothetical protein ACRD2C_08550, partial [Acidimicrobiales bacterium]